MDVSTSQKLFPSFSRIGIFYSKLVELAQVSGMFLNLESLQPFS